MPGDVRIDVRLKLSALWTATTLCYIYGDLFGFFKQQTIHDIAAGNAGPIGTQYGLLAAAVSVAIPSLMVAASLLLPANVDRWLNVVLGIAYTIVIAVTMPGAWAFYIFLGIVEAVLTLSIAWHAWTWPQLVRNQLVPDRGDR